MFGGGVCNANKDSKSGKKIITVTAIICIGKLKNIVNYLK